MDINGNEVRVEKMNENRYTKIKFLNPQSAIITILYFAQFASKLPDTLSCRLLKVHK